MLSPLIEQLVDRLRFLPGVGPKSAQRMALHLLTHDRSYGQQLAQALRDAMTHVGHCQSCHILCEQDQCTICAHPGRDSSRLCVVENPQDVISIEQTGHYKGFYFVLMGRLSPIDGIGPEDIGIDRFIARVQTLRPQEVILATNATMEGEATAHYLSSQLKTLGIACSRIAHGVPIGSELEYLDGRTIGQALMTRQVVVTETGT